MGEGERETISREASGAELRRGVCWTRVAQRLAWVAGGAIVWLLLLNLAKAPLVPQLEPSWMAAITHAAADRLQFGSEFIYTYGPLGHLAFSTYAEELFGREFVGRAALTAFLVCAVAGVAIRLPRVHAACLLAAAFVIGVLSYQAMYLFGIVSVGWLLCKRSDRNVLLIATGMLFLAVVALVKFTFLFFGILVLTIAAVDAAATRRYRDVYVPAAVFLLLFVGLWLLTGQAISGLPDFVRTGFEVTSGYARTMHLTAPPHILTAGLVVAFLIALQLSFLTFRERPRSRGFGIGIILAAATFLSWKLGFSRADAHTAEFFYFSVLASLAVPAFFAQSQPPALKIGHWVIAVAIAAVGAFAVFDQIPGTGAIVSTTIRNRWHGNPRAIFNPAADKAHWESVTRDYRSGYALPRIKEQVGAQSVTVYGYEQAIAFANGLQFVPFPTVQTYCDYTVGLAKRNAAFFRSAEAPAFVIFKLQTIDNRLPSVDGAEVLLQLAYDYEPLLVERGYLLLKRRGTSIAPQPHQLPTAKQGEHQLGKTVDVPKGTAWCELDIRQTFLGRLVSFFYQPPEVHVDVTTSTGEKIRRRILPSLASNGFLLSPVLLSEADFVAFAAGGGAGVPVATTVRIVNERRFRQLLRRNVGYRFRVLPEPPASNEASGLLRDLKGYADVFSRAADSVQSAIPVERYAVNGKQFLLVHPPGYVRFTVPAGATTVRGFFSIRPDAYVLSEGVRFEVMLLPTGGSPIQLFERTLTPRSATADQGLQSFQCALPAGVSGSIELRTHPGPTGTIEWGWAGWSEISFE